MSDKNNENRQIARGIAILFGGVAATFVAANALEYALTPQPCLTTYEDGYKYSDSYIWDCQDTNQKLNP